jgi:hypothetical protein
LVALAIVTAIKGWPALKRLQNESDGSLRSDLLGRIKALESQVDAMRAEHAAAHDRCDRIISEMRSQHALEMQELRERHLLELGRLVGRTIDGEQR